VSNQQSGRPEDHEPRNPNLDPSPTGDADLEAGGGVRPGHTPPDSQSATSTPPHAPDARPPRSKATLIVLIALVVILVLIFVAYAIGLWG